VAFCQFFVRVAIRRLIEIDNQPLIPRKAAHLGPIAGHKAALAVADGHLAVGSTGGGFGAVNEHI